MRQFGIRILMIIIFFVAFLKAADQMYTYVFSNSKPRSKFQFLRSFKGQKVNYIFLGSSRTENHINPRIIEEKTNKKAVNFGVQASKMLDIYTTLQLLDFYKISYDTVFIQIDYIFNIKGNSNILDYEMIPFIHESEIIYNHYKQTNNEFLKLKYIPFYRYAKYDLKFGARELFMSTLNKNNKIIENNGFIPKQGHILNCHDKLPDNVNKSNPYFIKIKKYITDHNKKVVFYTAPFRTNTKNIKFIDKLKLKVPKLIDFSRSIPNHKMFVDNYHLNEEGANLFTNKIIDSLLIKDTSE